MGTMAVLAGHMTHSQFFLFLPFPTLFLLHATSCMSLVHRLSYTYIFALHVRLVPCIPCPLGYPAPSAVTYMYVHTVTEHCD